MQIAENIKQEIDAIDVAKEKMEQKKIELRKFILSGEGFIRNYTEFDRLLSEWSDTLMTLVEAVGRSFNMEGLLGINNPNPLGSPNSLAYSRLEDGELTATKAAVIIAGISAGVILCYLFPTQWAIGVVVVAGAVVAPNFRKIVAALKGEEKKPESPSLNVLSGKISESISAMRDRHVKACFRLKFKAPDPNRLARHDPKEDKALYDYKQLVLETLPRWCMNRIDDITVECNGVAFGRKMVLYEYWRSGASSHQQPGQGKSN